MKLKPKMLSPHLALVISVSTPEQAHSSFATASADQIFQRSINFLDLWSPGHERTMVALNGRPQLSFALEQRRCEARKSNFRARNPEHNRWFRSLLRLMTQACHILNSNALYIRYSEFWINMWINWIIHMICKQLPVSCVLTATPCNCVHPDY